MIPEIEDVVPLRARLGDFGWVRFSFATEIVGDRVIPRQMEASLPGANGQPRLTLFIEVIGGVPRLTHLHLDQVDDGREVRQKDLRILASLDEWVEVIVARCSSRVVDSGDESNVRASVVEGDIRPAMRVVGEARKRSRRAMTEDVKRRIADVYNAADRYGLEDVQAAFGVSRPTAARYIRAAREAGLIEEKKK